MDYEAKYITADIKLSCYEDKFFKSDIMFDQHMLVWFISGETKIISTDATYFFRQGEIFLIPRNYLATIINYPKDGKPHKTVVMHLSTDFLTTYYQDLDVKPMTSSSAKILSFRNHPLLESCLSSLIPYFDLKDLPTELASLKIKEAVSILRSVNSDVDNVLANFEEPGKVDLAGYMEKNFMFNLTIDKFSYLTGRSLTTFKRDFHKAYNMTPQRWLTKKRLELAHYQLSEKKMKPTDVCFEVGFENLSHFSYAFKKCFGYAPSTLSS